MAAKKVNELIKEARTKAGLTQAQLADKVDGLSASDIGKAERGEKELTAANLKQIAKATGVTQTSLLNAPKASTKKTSTSTSSGKTSSSSKNELTLTATEKKLVELYRAADSDTKKSAMNILKGTKSDSSDLLGSLLSGAANLLGK